MIKTILLRLILVAAILVFGNELTQAESEVKGVIAQTRRSGAGTTKLAVDTYGNEDGSAKNQGKGTITGSVKQIGGNQWSVSVTNVSNDRVLGYFVTYEFNRSGKEVKKSHWTRYLEPNEMYQKKIFVSPSTMDLSLAVQNVEKQKK